MYLAKYQTITGIIHCVSGVRIGGNSNVIEIGTIDNPIIRNPLTNLPYLPGSSIKGKMRSALEMNLHQRAGAPPDPSVPRLQTIQYKDGSKEIPPCGCGSCVVCKLFGSSNIKKTFAPSRLIVRDCPLTEECLKVLEDAAGGSGVFFAEIKPGVRINRATNTAARKAFFNFERVPEGAEFQFEMVLRLYDFDNNQAEADFKKTIAIGMGLIEKEGLGGKITSGYGKVRFDGIKWDDKDWPFRAEK